MATSVQTVVKKVNSLKIELNNHFLEKEEVIDIVFLGLVSRQHVFMLGDPGTAKSLIISTVAKVLAGKQFSWLMNKFTMPEEIFGMTDVEALKKSIFRRIPKDKLPEAEIAILEEIFKASSAILNTLLFAMNERKWHNDGLVDLPLRTIFAPSNELPTDSILDAMFDRLALKVVVKPVLERKNFEQMLLNVPKLRKVEMKTKLSLAEIDRLHETSLNVPYEHMVPKIADVWRAMQVEKITASDRKWVQSIGILQANALLNGRDRVEEDDFEVYKHMLWTAEDQRQTIFNTLLKTINPSVSKVLEIKDEAVALYQQFEIAFDQATTGGEKGKLGGELNEKLNEYVVELEALADSKAKTEALEKLEGMLRTVTRKTLGRE